MNNEFTSEVFSPDEFKLLLKNYYEPRIRKKVKIIIKAKIVNDRAMITFYYKDDEKIHEINDEQMQYIIQKYVQSVGGEHASYQIIGAVRSKNNNSNLYRDTPLLDSVWIYYDKIICKAKGR